MLEPGPSFYPINRRKFARAMALFAIAFAGCVFGLLYAPDQTAGARVLFASCAIFLGVLLVWRTVQFRDLSPGLVVNDEGLSRAGDRPIPWSAMRTMRVIGFGLADRAGIYFELAPETVAALPRNPLLWRRSGRVVLNIRHFRKGPRSLVADIERRWKAAHPS